MSCRVVVDAVVCVCVKDEKTALDDYVQLDDGYFSFTELLSYRFEENATTVYMLNMTSQKWMDGGFFDIRQVLLNFFLYCEYEQMKGRKCKR